MTPSIEVHHNPYAGCLWWRTTGSERWRLVEVVDPRPVLASWAEASVSYTGPAPYCSLVREAQFMVETTPVPYGDDRELLKAAGLSKESPGEFKIMVAGTMSAGKSTLLNALIGQPLLPAGMLATTAKRATLRHVDGRRAAFGRAHGPSGVVAEGPVDGRALRRWNRQPDVSAIEVEIELGWVDVDRSARVVLIDSPGANFSGDRTHRRVLDEMLIESPDVLLFALDYTQLATDDEQELIQRILADERLRHRLLFVVNKVDELRAAEDPEILHTLDVHRGFLRERFQFEPRMFPVSARAGLLARTALGGWPLEEEEEHELERLAQKFQRVEVPEGWVDWLRALFRDPRSRRLEQLLARSGLRGLEREVSAHRDTFGAACAAMRRLRANGYRPSGVPAHGVEAWGARAS